MKKKFIYIGIGLFVAALLTFGISQSVIGSQAPSLQTNNFTIGAGNFSYTSVNASGIGDMFVLVKSSAPTNVYLLNSSAFGAWNRSLSANRKAGGEEAAASLEGKGTVMIYENSTLASIPPVSNSTGLLPVYEANSTSTFGSGEYYFVVDNTNGSASSNTVVDSQVIYVPALSTGEIASLKSGHLPSFIIDTAIAGGVMLILFIGGLASLAYGVVSKEKEKAGESVEENKRIDDLYKGVGSKKRGRRKGSGSDGS